MKIKVIRTVSTPQCCLGKLYIEDQFQCYTLEDRLRQTKLPGETAIPAGTYSLVLDKSVRFGRVMPHVLAVPGFEGVRIHSGNTDKDTQGCILVGQSQSAGRVEGSRLAFNALFQKLEQCKEAMTIQIVNPS